MKCGKKLLIAGAFLATTPIVTTYSQGLCPVCKKGEVDHDIKSSIVFDSTRNSGVLETTQISGSVLGGIWS